MLLIKFIILGFITGAITGITGASGVLIVVPVLSTFFDFPLHVVLGTSLLVDVIASIVVAFAYWRNKHVDIKNTTWLLIGSLIGAQAGSYFVFGVSKSFIIIAIAIAMILFGWGMWRSGKLKKELRIVNLPEKFSNILNTPIGLIICGLIIGLLTGIFGAGGGLSVFIILYSLLQFPLKTAVGTSTLIMSLTALSGVIGYVQYDNLDWSIGLVIGLAAAVGGIFSSIFANRISDEILSRLIGISFVLLAVVMVLLKVIFPLLGF
jgi:uncharacterized protein